MFLSQTTFESRQGEKGKRKEGWRWRKIEGREGGGCIEEGMSEREGGRGRGEGGRGERG